MEMPDVLVVTKADLGERGPARPRDLRAALRSLGAGHAGRARLLAAARRRDRRAGRRARRASGGARPAAARLARPADDALADFAAEHGERGLRALGGRREAERLLAAEDPALGTAELTRRLERLTADAGG